MRFIFVKELFKTLNVKTSNFAFFAHPNERSDNVDGLRFADGDGSTSQVLAGVHAHVFHKFNLLETAPLDQW